MDYSEDELIKIVKKVKERREDGTYINDDEFCKIVRSMKH